LKLRVTETLSTVDATAWNALAGDNPFLQHAFLHALHESDCASADTGWQPQYLLIEDQDQLVAAMPLYLKFKLQTQLFSTT
jgi:predicted N-acyltransferase